MKYHIKFVDGSSMIVTGMDIKIDNIMLRITDNNSHFVSVFNTVKSIEAYGGTTK